MGPERSSAVPSFEFGIWSSKQGSELSARAIVNRVYSTCSLGGSELKRSGNRGTRAVALLRGEPVYIGRAVRWCTGVVAEGEKHDAADNIAARDQREGRPRNRNKTNQNYADGGEEDGRENHT